jgi:hypothetical protein
MWKSFHIWKEITILHQLLRNERYTYVGALPNTLQRKMSWKLAIHVHNKIKHMESTYKTIVDFLSSTREGLKYSINGKMGVTTIHDNTFVLSPLWHRLDIFMFDHVACNNPWFLGDFSKHVDVETMFFGFPSQGGMGGTNQVITYVDHNSEEVLLND